MTGFVAQGAYLRFVNQKHRLFWQTNRLCLRVRQLSVGTGKLNSESRKIIAVAIGAEFLIIGAGLSLAAAIGWQSFSEHRDLTLAMSAATFPLILACLELFNIPPGYALYRSRWIMKPFALLLLVGGIRAVRRRISAVRLIVCSVFQRAIMSVVHSATVSSLCVISLGWN